MISCKEVTVLVSSCFACVLAFIMSVFATKVAEKYVIKVDNALGIQV